jgi:hypothetical protein
LNLERKKRIIKKRKQFSAEWASIPSFRPISVLTPATQSTIAAQPRIARTAALRRDPPVRSIFSTSLSFLRPPRRDRGHCNRIPPLLGLVPCKKSKDDAPGPSLIYACTHIEVAWPAPRVWGRRFAVDGHAVVVALASPRCSSAVALCLGAPTAFVV